MHALRTRFSWNQFANRRSFGGFHWQISPNAEAIFGSSGPDLEGWRRNGRARILKTGLQRTIERIELPGAALIVKTCRVNGPRSWFREVFRGSKARLEFENAQALIARGLPTAEPLAWASAHRLAPGTSILITRCVDAVPLQDFLERQRITLPLALARKLGTTLARMHEAGVAHPDPHPGNLLVTFNDESPTFTLIDVHSLRLGPPLSWSESLQNLVLFNRYFQLRASRTQRLAFWNAYRAGRTFAADQSAEQIRELEQRTTLSNARFWNHRMDRYRKSNRQYRVIGDRSVRGHAVRELPDPFVEWLMNNPDAPFHDPDARVLKDSRTSSVVELAVPTASGLMIAIYKRFNVKSSLHGIKNWFRRSPALRSWDFGQNLLDRGLPTARPLLVLERMRGGLSAEGYLLTERVPDARELSAAVADGPQRAWADSLGRLVRMLHDRQVAHRDLKAPNILMSGSGADATIVLIDLVGVEPGKPVSRAQRVRNLARLNASFVHSPKVTRTDRLRFLRAYLAWGLHGREGWKSWWNEIAAATDAKVARNLRTGRPLA